MNCKDSIEIKYFLFIINLRTKTQGNKQCQATNYPQIWAKKLQTL